MLDERTTISLEKTHKKIQEASNTMEQAATRTRVIERQLKNVQTLPENNTSDHLGLF